MKIRTYVLATKYSDGDPKDSWVVGLFTGQTEDNRYLVSDLTGSNYRPSGYREIKRISKERGAWLLENKFQIELCDKSMFWWLKQTMKDVL